MTLETNFSIEGMQKLCELSKDCQDVVLEPITVELTEKIFRAGILPDITIFKPTHEQLLGMARHFNSDLTKIEEEEDFIECAKTIFEEGKYTKGGRLRHIVCTCGADGARWLYLNEDLSIEHHHFPALPLKQIITVNGAGDAFLSGLLVGLYKYSNLNLVEKFTKSIEQGL